MRVCRKCAVRFQALSAQVWARPPSKCVTIYCYIYSIS